jgi:acyl-CoA synthetase (NDP forming)/GNAT superfamily N-acetyltransferase
VSAESTAPRSGRRPYPAHWEADVVLRDGGTAHLRPISLDDAGRLVEFYDEVSPRSKYYRFFAAMPTLSEREVRRFVDVDHHDRVALVLTIADRIIAVGQFERLPTEQGGRDHAEVAFLVQDRHQHRGIGQLLLEHLAQVGREVDVAGFVAEILPDNRGMLQVFREAGYQVSGGFEDGVVAMRFPIDATVTSLGVMVAREHRADTASVQRFLGARSVAVIGASRRAESVGRALVRNLVHGDFQGRLYAVNPTADAVSGVPAYPSITDVPDPVDIAVVAVPAAAVPDVLLDCAAKGVHGVVVISSGFAESGKEGRALQRQVLRLCRTYGLRLIGPNCLGVINTAADQQLNASLAPELPPRGRAGFFCQSGALGVAILGNVARRGLGLSTFVSAGNRADVSGNDLLQYWEEDEATELVLLYLESVGNPRKFSRIARRVSRRKPVIAVKSGRATQGVPMGHSVRTSAYGSLAVEAMFRQAGVIQVDSLDEMFDVAQLLAHQPLPRGNRMAVVGNSDALELLAIDTATAAGLEARSTDSGVLPADASAEQFAQALDAALADDSVDAVLAVYLPPVDTSGDDVAQVLAERGRHGDKPLLSSFLAAQGLPDLLRVPDAEGAAGRGSVPSYSAPDSAVRALARAVGYARWRGRPEGEVLPTDEVDATGGRGVVTDVLVRESTGRRLTDDELERLLAAYGVVLWPRVAVSSVKAAVAAGEQLGWNVVLKATAERLRQRPDLAHVQREIQDAEHMREAWRRMRVSVGAPRAAGFVVQRNAPPGVPVGVRGLEDPLFGPLVSFGMSGFVSDLLGDRVLRIPPLDRRDAAEMVSEIKAAPLLTGYRGSAPVDVDAVETLLLKVAQLKNDLPEVRSLDLPLVLVSGEGAHVLSAEATVEPAANARTGWFERRLSDPVTDTSPG